MIKIWRNFSSLEESGARQAFVHTIRGLIDLGGQRVSAVDRLYLAAELPTLIVWGERDPLIPVRHAHEAHERALHLAEDLVGESIADRTMRTWATRAMVGYIFDSLQAWLDVGDPSRDDEFVERATAGAVAIFSVLTGIDVRADAPD